MPQGYKVAYHAKTNKGAILEMIPKDEILPEWSEMLTVQVFRNTNEYTLASFYAGMSEAWAEMCPCGSTEIIERGCEQHQSTLLWRQDCPLNKNTGMPEYTWFKLLIIDGKLVIIQKAFKFAPADKEITFWLDFLREIRVDHAL